MADEGASLGGPAGKVAAVPTSRLYSLSPAAPTPRWAWVALFFIVFAGAFARLPGLGAPIVGYHAFNEAFYFGNAVRDLPRGLLSPFFGQSELNPPLYSFMLRLVMSIFEPTILVARAFSTVAALGTSVALFFLGKRLYGLAAGLGAALVIALAPGSVLIARNIQIEAVLGLVLIMATLSWVIAVDDDSIAWAVGAGVFAGLAVMLKLQGVVILPAFVLAELFRSRSPRSLIARVPLAAFMTFCLVGLPWHIWNVLQPTRAAMLGTRASEMGMPDARFLDLFFARELLWMLSPLFAIAGLIGVTYLLWRHRPSDVLVLLATSANVAFYFFYHLHTYYLYSAVPFAALAIGALLQPLERRGINLALAALCVAALIVAPFAVTELAGKKLGYWSIDQVAVAAVAKGVDTGEAALAVDHPFRQSWEPALRLYGRGMDIVSNPLLTTDVLKPGEALITLDSAPRPASADATPLVRLSDQHVMPVFFGYAVDQSHDALFFLAIDQPRAIWVGPWWRFGTTTRIDPLDWWASLLSPAFTAKIREDAIRETPAPVTAP